MLPETVIFTQDIDGKLEWAKIVSFPVVSSVVSSTTAAPTTSTTAFLTTSRIVHRVDPAKLNDIQRPEQIERRILPDKPPLRWAEQWESSYLQDTVDTGTGQVNLRIPLIDISATTGWKLQFALAYNSKISDRPDIIGNGWLLPLATDFIALDHKGSIFPDDARYYLASQGNHQALNRTKTEGNLQQFRLADDADGVKITYNKDKQQWLVEGPTENIIYGNADGNMARSAVQWSLAWPNWRGAGSNTAQLISEATSWYAQKRVDKINGKELRYNYEQVLAKLSSGKEYTEAIRLKSVTDGRNMQLNFQYGLKTPAEYSKPESVNRNGQVVFPVPLLENFYLRGYELTTETYSQKLRFKYQVTDGVRLLTGFEQPIGSYIEPLFRFTYKNISDKHVLQDCVILPENISMKFSYESVTPPIPVVGQNNIITYPVRESVKLSYGPDFVVMVVKQDGIHFVVRVLNRSMSKTISEFPLNVNGSSAGSEVKDYALLAFKNWFFMFAISDTSRVLHIFHRNEQTWANVPTVYVFGKDALVRFSETLVVVAESNLNKLMLIERVEAQDVWNSSTIDIPRALVSLVLQDKMIVGYDYQQLLLLWRDSENRWKRKILGSNLGNITQTLSRFDLESGKHKEYVDSFNLNALHIQNNLVLLSSLDESNGKLFSRVHLFLLNADYDVATRSTFDVERETIQDITSEIKNGLGTFVLAYVKKDGKFTLRIKSVSGYVATDAYAIGNRELRKDKFEEIIQELHDNSSWQEMLKKSFPIDWTLYQAKIVQEGVQLGTDILYRHTGTDWTRETAISSDAMPLGKHMLLETSGDSKTILKLYRQDGNQRRHGSPILELKLSSPGALLNRFPAYVAYQQTKHVVGVVTFQDDKTIGQTYTYAEQLLPESDWQNLITIANASSTTMTHSEGQEVLVRPIATLLPHNAQLYVNLVSEVAGNTERKTGYKRSFSTGNSDARIYNESVTIIPGDSKSRHGCYRSTRSYDVDTGNITEIEEYFDGNGKQVEPPPKHKSDLQADDTSSSRQSSEPNPHVLLDKSGQWLISDFSPYSLLDEMVGYYGFEAYESNVVAAGRNGTSPKYWDISQGRIIQGGFSFTGENYLQLRGSVGNDSFLEGVLRPADQATTYLAACWLRSSEKLLINKPAAYLKAVISTTTGKEIIGLLGETKRQIGEWHYIELPLDFQVIREIYRDYVTDLNENAKGSDPTTTLPMPDEAKFEIALRIEATYPQTIDVDHIRFAPITHDFQATVYHKFSGSPTAEIHENGMVTKSIYNRLNVKMASINEEGQIESFTTSCTTGNFLTKPHGSSIAAKPNILTLQPESGSYEYFSPNTIGTIWKIGTSSVWKIAVGQLWHVNAGKHTVTAAAHLFDGSSAAIRLWFGLQESGSLLSLTWNGVGSLTFIRKTDGLTRIDLPNGRLITPVPCSGELVVMLDNKYLFTWLDGVLLADELLQTSTLNPWSSFSVSAEKRVLIEDLLIMNRPSLRVEYLNEFDEKTQVLNLEDPETVLVQETLHDELGREAIVTKATRVKRSGGQPILAYRDDFAVNTNPSEVHSVWRSGRLEGEVSHLNNDDNGVAYTRVEYAKNPLNQEIALGQPGPIYSVTGSYSVKKSRYSNIHFLDNLFPPAEKFRQEVDYTPNGNFEVRIFDKVNNQVAKYVRVPSYNHLLSTYEYDSQNRLIKILPPLYHVMVATASKLTPWQPGENHLTNDEKRLQKHYATRYDYNKAGNLVCKTTPDTGSTHYLYNRAGQKRFMVSGGSSNESQTIVYFNYDEKDQLIQSGYISRPLPLSTLYDHLETDYIPYGEAHQEIDFADDHLDPNLRGRLRSLITFNDGEVITDNLRFDGQGHIVSKISLSATGDIESNKLTHFKRQYGNGKMHVLEYPVEVNGSPLRLVHRYNRLGQLVGLGTSRDPLEYASFTYHATGQLASENYQPNQVHSFSRNYGYNSPGFLEKISDKFLIQEVAYTNTGYGQVGQGNGIVMQTTFNASWPLDTDPMWFEVDSDNLVGNYTPVCINALKRTGFLSKSGRPLKLLVRRADVDIPDGCTGPRGDYLATLLAQKQRPGYYGFKFAYDAHQALTKAKYFTAETASVASPLQPDSFAKIPGINKSESEHIWQLLADGNFIIPDQQHNNPATAIGKRGDQFMVPLQQLSTDLEVLNGGYLIYAPPISRLLLSAISQRKHISSAEFETSFMYWSGLRDKESPDLRINERKEDGRRIFQMLANKGYLTTQSVVSLSALNSNFTTALHRYSAFIPEIVQELSTHFSHQIGETAFDLESYNIDANGNHRLFYNGFSRY